MKKNFKTELNAILKKLPSAKVLLEVTALILVAIIIYIIFLLK